MNHRRPVLAHLTKTDNSLELLVGPQLTAMRPASHADASGRDVRAADTFERLAATCSQAELVQNPEDVETLARLGVPRAQLHRLGNGTDLARFDTKRLAPDRRPSVAGPRRAPGPSSASSWWRM